ERPRGGQFIVERFGSDLLAVVGRRRRPPHLAADLALLLAGEGRQAVAEVLRDERDRLRHNAVVEALPAGIAVERFRFEGRAGPLVGEDTADEACQKQDGEGATGSV